MVYNLPVQSFVFLSCAMVPWVVGQGGVEGVEEWKVGR